MFTDMTFFPKNLAKNVRCFYIAINYLGPGEALNANTANIKIIIRIAIHVELNDVIQNIKKTIVTSSNIKCSSV